ncbi:protein involved in C cytochrome biogenesis [Methylopila jiangsuensis]|uniref:Protein involved in C cytochrome biogenesis n=1 Tax=Methylopila jiangsuensis TaxID=586230 RepID=A0A9W6JKQ4_9HYPH|nr:protein-disulfide reductase DsbD domain-containing protein [Methylopila jiangsuensis]MDR6284731.1 DsbC/DsbD-like thiol-disulfide interchange protein [Methylopila jiangsuensis]GLK77879.1 protein involved in C cytochrome biogenesis [Methylopila jiangsuensis]
MPRLCFSVLFAVALLLAPSAGAEPASPWIEDGASALRLVDAGEGEGGARIVGLAIRLEAGWKTYWRQPGDSGVPPQFDFSRSENVGEVTVVFPAPERMTDEAGVANVYHGEVLLPLKVRPKTPGAPVRLAVTADYGVCEKVCVPAQAQAALELAPDGFFPGPAAAAVHRALASAPKRVAFGAEADGLAIAAIRRRANDEIEVTAKAPAPGANLFAETGDGGFAPSPQPVPDAPAGEARFRIPFTGALPQSGLRLTLAVKGRAIEVAAPLDALVRTP